MDCSPPGSSVHRMLQAGILEWVAVSFSRGLSQPRDRTRLSEIEIFIWQLKRLPGCPGSKESACNIGDQVSIPGLQDPLEKEMATHSSILAWRIPWTEEPGRLQSMGLQRVRHDWATNTFLFSDSWRCSWILRYPGVRSSVERTPYYC